MEFLIFLLPVVLAVSLGCFVSRLLRTRLKWSRLWVRLFSGLVSCVVAGGVVAALGYSLSRDPSGGGDMLAAGLIFFFAPFTGVVGFILGLGGR